MRLRHFTILFTFLLILTSCSSNSNKVDAKEHLGDIYSVALDSILEKDEALNSEMEYIAIDMSNFSKLNEQEFIEQEFNEQDKEEIISFFKKKYLVQVIDASYEELQEQGLYNPGTKVLDGVLLKIEKIDFVSNDFVFEGSKFRSGDGAVGVKGIVHLDGETWKIKESKVTLKS